MEKYHEGEISIQQKAGEEKIAERNGRMISDKIITGAVNFIENQFFFLASSRNADGELVVSALGGAPGFIRVVKENTLELLPELLNSNPYDMFWSNIQDNIQIGLLFIELASRRRFRINGKVSIKTSNKGASPVNGESPAGPASHIKKLQITVEQAYPNCPKYIQKRVAQPIGRTFYNHDASTGSHINPLILEIIKNADTFFVGSCSREGSMDVSHRGGLPGFVHIEDACTLLIPDYPGNSMYNTLGNFHNNPNAALLFMDYNKAVNVQISGTAHIVWKGDGRYNNEIHTGGTNRLWMFKITKWIMFENLTGITWTFNEYSPFNPI